MEHKHIPTLQFVHIYMQTDAYFTNCKHFLSSFSTCKHINTEHNTLTPTLQLLKASVPSSYAPFPKYIPSRFTLLVLKARFTAHTRNGKPYLSSGTGPCKSETDDVAINLSRIPLCRFWIVKARVPETPVVSWFREQLWSTGRRTSNKFHFRTDVTDVLLYNPWCWGTTLYGVTCQKDLTSHRFLGKISG